MVLPTRALPRLAWQRPSLAAVPGSAGAVAGIALAFIVIVSVLVLLARYTTKVRRWRLDVPGGTRGDGGGGMFISWSHKCTTEFPARLQLRERNYLLLRAARGVGDAAPGQDEDAVKTIAGTWGPVPGASVVLQL